MEPRLEREERVVLSARPHGAALVRPLGRLLVGAAAGAVCILLGAGVHWLLPALGAVALILAAADALAVVWQWDRTAVIVTTEKLLLSSGVTRRRVTSVSLARPGGVELRQGVVGRLLGYGTLVAGELEISYVARAREIARLLR